MSLFGIAWRTIRQRLLTSGLTALSLALGVALVVATLVIGDVVTQAFKSGSGLGYNMIVGAKGSPLQLVLNSVYLISKPIENIPWAFYEEFLPATARPARSRAACRRPYRSAWGTTSAATGWWARAPPTSTG